MKTDAIGSHNLNYIKYLHGIVFLLGIGTGELKKPKVDYHQAATEFLNHGPGLNNSQILGDGSIRLAFRGGAMRIQATRGFKGKGLNGVCHTATRFIVFRVCSVSWKRWIN